MKRIAGRVLVGIREPLGGALRRGYKDFSGKHSQIEYDDGDDVQPAGLAEANIYTSQIRDDPRGRHMVILDLDVPVQVFHSANPGHSHLYIEKPVDADDYFHLMGLLVRMGIVEQGYLGASLSRGYGVLRAPWMPKKKVTRPLGGLLAEEARRKAEEARESQLLADAMAYKALLAA